MPQRKYAQSIDLTPDTPTKEITRVLLSEVELVKEIYENEEDHLLEYSINNISILTKYLDDRFQNVH